MIRFNDLVALADTSDCEKGRYIAARQGVWVRQFKGEG